MEIADLIFKINQAYPKEIEKQDFVRAISDTQFNEFAKWVFEVRFIGYLIIYVLPFNLHLLILKNQFGM